MGRVFWNFQLEKALQEVIDISKGKGSWEDWERRWPKEVKEKAEREIQVFQMIGLVDRADKK